jgi:hypothetical protein
MAPDISSNAPTGTLALVTKPDFMNSELFPEWLQHFAQHARPTMDNPALLILDNHISHCTLAAVVFCRENHITHLSLPPHVSHKLQTLNVRFFGPLKAMYSHEVDNWLVTNPGNIMSQRHVTDLFCTAYIKIVTLEKAGNAFAATDLPYFQNAKIISHEDF